MNNYVTLSLETHLFFSRIMKEHSLFLMAGFPCKNDDCIKKADWYREKFEDLLRQVVQMSDGVVGRNVLESGEVTTVYTEKAEECTSCLTGIPIDSEITERAERLSLGRACERESREDKNSRRMQMNRQGRCANRNYCQMNNQGRYNPMNSNAVNNRQRELNRQREMSRQRESEEQRMVRQVREVNEKALELLKGLICFKEDVLKNVEECRIFTANYPLLLRHIIREAKLYQETIAELNEKGHICSQNLRSMEQFWNRIMMEHALFIRGLLDPSEEELIKTADEFAGDYRKLLREAKDKDLRAMDELTRNTIKETIRYRDFKAEGTKGITGCQIESIILPLLADHVLREANHYLRILEEGSR